MRHRGGVVAERQLEEAERGKVQHARVLLLRGRCERRTELREGARLVGAAEVRGDDRLPVHREAAVVLETDLLPKLVRLVGLSGRLAPVPRAERDVDEAAADAECRDLVAEGNRFCEQRLEELARLVEMALVHAQQRERHARAAIAEEGVRGLLDLDGPAEQRAWVAPGPELPEREPREDVDNEAAVARALRVVEREAAVLERGDHAAQRP